MKLQLAKETTDLNSRSLIFNSFLFSRHREKLFQKIKWSKQQLETLSIFVKMFSDDGEVDWTYYQFIFPDLSLSQVMQKYIELKFDTGFADVSKQEWTAEEDQSLMKYVDEHKVVGRNLDWSTFELPDKELTTSQINLRYVKLLSQRKPLKKVRKERRCSWTLEMDQQLINYVEDHTENGRISWKAVLSLFPEKKLLAIQLRYRTLTQRDDKGEKDEKTASEEKEKQPRRQTRHISEEFIRTKAAIQIAIETKRDIFTTDFVKEKVESGDITIYDGPCKRLTNVEQMLLDCVCGYCLNMGLTPDWDLMQKIFFPTRQSKTLRRAQTVFQEMAPPTLPDVPEMPDLNNFTDMKASSLLPQLPQTAPYISQLSQLHSLSNLMLPDRPPAIDIPKQKTTQKRHKTDDEYEEDESLVLSEPQQAVKRSKKKDDSFEITDDNEQKQKKFTEQDKEKFQALVSAADVNWQQVSQEYPNYDVNKIKVYVYNQRRLQRSKSSASQGPGSSQVVKDEKSAQKETTHKKEKETPKSMGKSIFTNEEREKLDKLVTRTDKIDWKAEQVNFPGRDSKQLGIYVSNHRRLIKQRQEREGKDEGLKENSDDL